MSFAKAQKFGICGRSGRPNHWEWPWLPHSAIITGPAGPSGTSHGVEGFGWASFQVDVCARRRAAPYLCNGSAMARMTEGMDSGKAWNGPYMNLPASSRHRRHCRPAKSGRHRRFQAGCRAASSWLTAATKLPACRGKSPLPTWAVRATCPRCCCAGAGFLGCSAPESTPVPLPTQPGRSRACNFSFCLMIPLILSRTSSRENPSCSEHSLSRSHFVSEGHFAKARVLVRPMRVVIGV